MNRRSLLRGVAVAGAGGGAALAGVAVSSEDAGAQTAMTLDVTGDSATLGPDATVTAVRLDIDVSWSYELHESASPETAIVEIAAGPTDGSLTVVDSAESAQLFTSADGEQSFDADLLAAGALDGSALAPDAGTRETSVTVEARLRVEDSAGEALASATASDTATVTVEREGDPSEYGSVGGSGSLTIETSGE